KGANGMDTCSAGRCKITCPPGGCGCVYVYDTDTCECECFGTEPSGSSGLLSLGNKVDVSVSGLPLGQVAAKFDRLLASRAVLVPAARVKKTVRVRLRGVSVSAALKALGLTTQKGPRKARRVVRRPRGWVLRAPRRLGTAAGRPDRRRMPAPRARSCAPTGFRDTRDRAVSRRLPFDHVRILVWMCVLIGINQLGFGSVV